MEILYFPKGYLLGCKRALIALCLVPFCVVFSVLLHSVSYPFELRWAKSLIHRVLRRKMKRYEVCAVEACVEVLVANVCMVVCAVFSHIKIQGIDKSDNFIVANLND